MRENKHLKIAISIVFWFVVWLLSACAVNQILILPTPAEVFSRLVFLFQTKEFWISAGSSLLRILLGFLCGLIAGTIFAVLSELWFPADAILSPLIRFFRTAPVASFIILIMLWVNYDIVPAVISAIMVVPVVYQNVRTGIQQVNPDYLLLAEVYRFSLKKRWGVIYVPSVLPYFLSAAVTSLGLAWKSGVAAEVLCLPKYAVGSKLYFSKLYLETPDLFAWTIVVVFFSLLLEYFLKKLVSAVNRKGGTEIDS